MPVAPSRFAFVIHPLLATDIARRFRVLRHVPATIVEWGSRALPPQVVSHISGIQSPTGASAEGWFIGLPLTAQTILGSEPELIYHRLVQCGRLAQRLGAQILGLGAFTKVVGDAGITVAARLELGVTTGNSYTAASAVEGAMRAADCMRIDLRSAHALVVGATGSIGAVCSQLLAPHVGVLTLVARNLLSLETLAAKIQSGATASPSEVRLTTDMGPALSDADLVIAVTSSTDALIEPGQLRPGAVVCDVARPRNVSRHIYAHRRDVLVIDGGLIEVPGQVEFGLDFGCPPKMCEACMAETMILALEGMFDDFTLGREIALDRVQEICTLASRHGFRVAGLRRFDRAISDDEIDAIRHAAEHRRGTRRV